MNELRILICGGRDLTKSAYPKVEEIIVEYLKKPENKQKDIVFITGMAKGADSAALYLYDKYVCKLDKYPANWKDLTELPCVVKSNKYGEYNALAGHNRNQRMLDEGKPDVVFAFWDGKSKGTKDMVDRSLKLGVEVIINGY